MNGSPEQLLQPQDLVTRILQAYQATPRNSRLIVGIAGAPASGKSTLAEWLVLQINTQALADSPGTDSHPAIVVPMDGYHLDNTILDQRGLRAVKGAPHTFDAKGFHVLLERLRAPLNLSAGSGSECEEETIYIPVFDRAMDLARCAVSTVEGHHRIIVVEGNYLLLGRPEWCDLRHCLDLCVMLDVPLFTLEERLIQRWIDHGMNPEAAKVRAQSNDIPNAIIVTEESTSPQLVLKSVRQYRI